jgi:hypothetical protein
MALELVLCGTFEGHFSAVMLMDSVLAVLPGSGDLKFGIKTPEVFD